MNEEEIREMQEEAERREKARQERGDATDEQLNQAYKELQNPKDPRREEKFLEKRAKRKKAEEEGDDPNIAGTAGGLGFEVAAGVATDKATSFLLNPLLGPKGIALYGLANFASGAVANAIAQRMRGDTSFSLGEILASGAAGVIPGTTAKLGKKGSKIFGKANTIKRAGIAGGLTGVGSEQIRVGIDEKRPLTFNEAALAGAVGGTASASLQRIARGASNIANDYYQRLQDEAMPVLAMSPTKVIDPIDGDEFGTYLSDAEVFKTISQWKTYRPSQQEVNEIRSTLLKFGMVGNRFDYNIFKAATKRDKKTGFKRFTANQERALISLFVTPPITKVDYNKVSKRVMPAFRKQYKPMLDALGIPASELQLHHLLPLKASLPLYHGLVYDSDEWWQLTAFLLKRHIKAGDSEANLRKLIGAGKRSVQDETAPLANKERPLKTPHSISHQHVRDEFAEDGSKFFTQDVLDSIYDNQARRLEVADAYTRKMRRNFDLTNQAQKVYEMTFDPKNKFTMKDVVRTMTRLDNDGYLDGDRVYQVDIINDMIEGIKREGGGNEYMKYLDRQTEQDFIATQNRLRQERLARNQDIEDFERDLREMVDRDRTVGFSRVSNKNDAVVAAQNILRNLFELPDGTFRSYTITLPNGQTGELTYELATKIVGNYIFENL
jgi:hypothetical protein